MYSKYAHIKKILIKTNPSTLWKRIKACQNDWLNPNVNVIFVAVNCIFVTTYYQEIEKHHATDLSNQIQIVIAIQSLWSIVTFFPWFNFNDFPEIF